MAEQMRKEIQLDRQTPEDIQFSRNSLDKHYCIGLSRFQSSTWSGDQYIVTRI